MHCENCGTAVGTDSKFCANCGSSMRGSLGGSRSPHVSTSRKRHPPKLLIAFVASIPVILLGVYLLLFESESSKIKNIREEASEQAKRIHDVKITAKEHAGETKTVQKDTVTQECLSTYMYAVEHTALSTQIVTLQTLATEDGKEMVLSVVLKDGSNVKYLIKLAQVDAATKESISKVKVSSWDMEQSGTVLSIGESPLPLGVALKVSRDPKVRNN